MKYTLKVIPWCAFTLFISYWSMACEEGIAAKDIGKVKMYAGGDNADITHHQHRLLATLDMIEEAHHKYKESSTKQNFLRERLILPKEFHRQHVLALANEIGFSPADDIETRRNKFIRLSLLLRDIYDRDNNISQKLNLLSPLDKHRMSAEDIMNMVVLSFEEAIALSLIMQTEIPIGRAIDFHLSFAELLLWRLHYGERSTHMMWDFGVVGLKVVHNPLAKRLKATALYQLKMVAEYLKDSSVDLPVIYHRDLFEVAKSLNFQQKYELFKMYKSEMEEENKTIADDPALELERALNGSSQDEWLDDFMPEKVELYFTQEILQRFLLKKGIISRDALSKILLSKVHDLRIAIEAITFQNGHADSY